MKVKKEQFEVFSVPKVELRNYLFQKGFWFDSLEDFWEIKEAELNDDRIMLVFWSLSRCREATPAQKANPTKVRMKGEKALKAILVLKEHREKQQVMRLTLGTYLEESDLVFSHPGGSPLLPDTVSHAWAKLTRRVGLKNIRLHDARHSHASLMLKQGIHPKIVQERLGHASIQITLDTYSHVAPGLQEAAALRFDEALTSTPREELVEKLG